ncbi:MAG: SDR family oxidoreductase [Chloroflexi bacterium]|nr:SDR family oxidoreductase [Chloroflexota bacterium]
MRLKGKVAIVTGGAQGIGRAYCLRFAQEGAAVGIADLRIEQAKAVESEIIKAGGKALAVRADVSNEESANAMAKEVYDRFGRVDILVNNAAIYYDMDSKDQSIAYLRKMIDVNLIGIIICGRAVFPIMKDQGGGSIINISSGAAYVLPQPMKFKASNFSTYHYGLTKSGAIYLTKMMAMTGGPYNIRVNAIAPGVTMSEATKKVVAPQMIDGLKNVTALGKSLEPWDLTGTAVYLASEDSAMVTGQTIPVDAGLVMLG